MSAEAAEAGGFAAADADYNCSKGAIMHLSLTPQTQKLINSRLESGKYKTAEDVITAALSQLDQAEQLGQFESGELDRLLEEGERSGVPLDGDQVLAELRNLRK